MQMLDVGDDEAKDGQQEVRRPRFSAANGARWCVCVRVPAPSQVAVLHVFEAGSSAVNLRLPMIDGENTVGRDEANDIMCVSGLGLCVGCLPSPHTRAECVVTQAEFSECIFQARRD